MSLSNSKIKFDYLDIKTPLGALRICASENGLKEVQWITGIKFQKTRNKHCNAAHKQLFGYFNKSRREFSVALDADGTDFQKRVWRACASVQFGKTVTYGELAAIAKCPTGSRAVGNALGKNPLPIIIPCHRIVSSNKKIGGYSGRGGLKTKQLLLKLEAF